MTPEHPGAKLGRPVEDPLLTAQKRLGDPARLVRDRRARVTLHRRGGPETMRLASLPSLAPFLNHVLVDQEGDLYLLRWQIAKIPPGYKILGSRPRPGWDYAEKQPKTKIPKRLVFAHYPKGIDVLLRGTDSILSNYLVERGTQAGEVEQMKAVAARLLMLKVCLASFPQLSGEDLDRIVKENVSFLEDNRFLKPQDPEKQRIQRLLERGFRDSLGRKNYLAALRRLYGIELAIVRRHVAFAATLTKYSGIFRVVEFKRNSTRFTLDEANRILGEVLERPAFADPKFGQQPREAWIEKARSVWKVLRTISESFVRNVEARPYILVTRKAIEHFGAMDLPEGTIAARVQKDRERRAKENRPTVTDYLRDGDFANAKRLIEKVCRMLKKTLDVHADWRTVKPSRKAKKRGNSPIPSHS